ncbi:unnamed protein product [Polarella glacialis]|uniref:Uncharacterized protein n=1 Tax=Polarella glacialis TaxID=89957 RepID=A0A813DVK2_POLGL|nr:unnamed protein product [Polarella glacialis]
MAEFIGTWPNRLRNKTKDNKGKRGAQQQQKQSTGPLHACSACACSVHPDSSVITGRSLTNTSNISINKNKTEEEREALARANANHPRPPGSLQANNTTLRRHRPFQQMSEAPTDNLGMLQGAG